MREKPRQPVNSDIRHFRKMRHVHDDQRNRTVYFRDGGRYEGEFRDGKSMEKALNFNQAVTDMMVILRIISYKGAPF